MSSPHGLRRKERPIEGLVSVKNPDYIESVFDLTEEKVERLKRVKPKLLGIRCRRSDCDKGLHCFDAVKMRPKFPKGQCQECGLELVKWDEVWLRDTRDVDRKFAFFETEWIRHFFFHVPLTERIRKYARTHGLDGLGGILEDQLRNKKMLKYMRALEQTDQDVGWHHRSLGPTCRWLLLPTLHDLLAQYSFRARTD